MLEIHERYINETSNIVIINNIPDCDVQQP